MSTRSLFSLVRSKDNCACEGDELADRSKFEVKSKAPLSQTVRALGAELDGPRRGSEGGASEKDSY